MKWLELVSWWAGTWWSWGEGIGRVCRWEDVNEVLWSEDVLWWLYFPKMTTTVFPAFLQHDLAISLVGGAGLCSLSLNLGRFMTTVEVRLDHTWWYSVLPGSLGISFLKPRHFALKSKQPRGEDTYRCPSQQPVSTTRREQWAFRRLWLFKSSQLTVQTLLYSDKLSPSEFLTHRICGQNQMFLFCFGHKFGVICITARVTGTLNRACISLGNIPCCLCSYSCSPQCLQIEGSWGSSLIFSKLEARNEAFRRWGRMPDIAWRKKKLLGGAILSQSWTQGVYLKHFAEHQGMGQMERTSLGTYTINSSALLPMSNCLLLFIFSTPSSQEGIWFFYVITIIRHWTEFSYQATWQPAD